MLPEFKKHMEFLREMDTRKLQMQKYICSCGAEYNSDIPYQKVWCLNCGAIILKVI